MASTRMCCASRRIRRVVRRRVAAAGLAGAYLCVSTGAARRTAALIAQRRRGLGPVSPPAGAAAPCRTDVDYAHCLRGRRRGGAGREPDEEHYLELYGDSGRFPDVRAELRELFESFRQLGSRRFVEVTQQSRDWVFGEEASLPASPVDEAAAVGITEVVATEAARPGVGSDVVVQERWRLERVVGQGGLKTVYEGHQPETGRKAAVKVLHRPSPHAARRCRYEAGPQAASEHPYTAPVFTVSETVPNDVVLIEKLVQGDDWSQLIHCPDFGLECNLEVLLRVAQAVQQAHEKGFIHRDIKPRNVKVSTRLEDGRQVVDQVYLLDFGLALSVRDREPTDVVALPREQETRAVIGTGPTWRPRWRKPRRTLSIRLPTCSCWGRCCMRS